ncbi:MAG: hypothetical protein AB4058_21200 [Microcystaceae cyanobacterium]
MSSFSDLSRHSPVNSTPTPIPTPSHPRQNLAIGLVKGIFRLTEGEINRGTLLAENGDEIEAVLLGKMFSLLKKHISLSQSHLWVVYPRTRQESDRLHLQITGVWEPETLHPDIPNPETFQLQDGFFSIRGEVVYASKERQVIIVKIRQSPKQDSKKIKFFKLKLQGILSEKPVGRFWDLTVQRQGNNLVVLAGEDLGWSIKRKQPFAKKFTKKRPSRPTPEGDRSKPRLTPTPKMSSKPVPKRTN